MFFTNSSRPSHEPSTAGSKLAENTPYGTPRRTLNSRNTTKIGGCRSSPVTSAAAHSAASPAADAASAAAGSLRATRHSTSSESRNASSPSRSRHRAHSSHSSSLTDASTTSRDPSRNDTSGIHAGTRAPAASPRYPSIAGTPVKESAATAWSFHSTLRSGSPPGRSASMSARRSSSSAPPKTSDSSTTPASTRFWRKVRRSLLLLW
ncbi:hypothetical protein GQ55_8G062200 [Panicum hallii var. hallii]|uniref:Uncharacterized protein n=1 Tax=Panicum hallii var. hallii TaxID=1504633 RepID=A0A2T7CLG6_9POAL|nr:hypothetical protein GQ55_8G062200 [Panicum hallii var. hallii]